MTPKICARQMRAAIEEVLYKTPRTPHSWREAQLWHQMLYSDQKRDLQRDDNG